MVVLRIPCPLAKASPDCDCLHLLVLQLLLALLVGQCCLLVPPGLALLHLRRLTLPLLQVHRTQVCRSKHPQHRQGPTASGC